MNRDLPEVGRALERFEDARFLRGEGCFVDDMQLPGMCHAVIVRSAVAHGRLVGIDASAALEMPGVLAVLTHADIAAWCSEIPVRVGPVPGFEHFLQLPIAVDTVRYVGEPLAVVIAEDRYVAEDGADLVYADIEPLDVVADMDRALHGEVFVHAHRASNVAAHYEVSRGDPDAVFAKADYVRKECFHCHRHSSVPLETRGLLAQWDAATGRLSVWGAAKVPFYNRRLLAQMMGLAEDRIDQIEIDVGGSFGSRGEFYPEDLLIPAAARRVGRPVKWIEDRRENLIAMNHSRDIDCELEIAATREGRILGLRARMRTDIGAYARTTGGIVSAKAASFLPGPYDIANYHCEVHALVTNKTPSGTYRGPGRYEANFFRERLMDMMAQDLGLDPAAMRLRNLIRREQMPYPMGKLVPYEGAAEYDTGDYPAVFRQALEKIDYAALAGLRGRQVDGKFHGIGMACFVDSSGAGPAEYARLVVRSADEFDLYSGASSSGQGHETSFAQILADELGVAAQQVRVHHGSTTGLAHGFGTYHGRGLVMGGSAVKRVGETFVSQLLKEAARRQEGAADDLRYERGAVMNDRTQQPVLTIRQLCEEAAQGSEMARELLEADGSFEQKVVTFEYGSQIVHVTIDPMTWVLEVERLVTVGDCGTVINPLIVHGQVLGASVQGLGGALLEEFVYDAQGQMVCGSFADYLLPTSTDFPRVEAYHMDLGPSLLNPLGAKGVGEGGIEGAGGAIANAVADALQSLGVEVVALPLSPNHIARLVREARHRSLSDGLSGASDPIA
ncbi:Caffeine dehydrogenase subunit alpha (plasmid) [Variovorax sp. SRS16]|uniref:xanthine dehydrogenase family protein molybdopterin-binding subunit n=1 Tax=Variovorax sp. SRS16 TaxID=282217 RepID=UPI0013179C82|nr:xanthine dehydrogenase family protein molybdopterin-binding subunit [Variovorax sp. SRS16]VTU46565.1 Caffeine dehydrogenase subunit alpha [Variovorax sp. SRS16]